jgi:tetratricopeptide (TPR) repeat protein
MACFSGATHLIAAIATVFLCVLPGGEAAGAQPGSLGVSVEEDSITRVDPDSGEQLWTVVHASVWDTTQREKQIFEITEPVLLDEYLYYGVRSWLIQLDPATGVIRERHWFPSTIADVEKDGDELLVVVESANLVGGDEKHETVFRWRPGATSPTQIWNFLGLFRVWKDVSYLAPKSGARIYEDGEFSYPDYEPEEIERDLAKLQKRSSQEPSNPFYDYFLGRIHERAGDVAQATEAYERSLTAEGAQWSTWAQLAAFLDGVGRHDLADRAFERAQELIERGERIWVRRWSTQLAHILLMGVGMREQLDYAVRQEDFERVDRMHSRIAWMFPYIEHGSTAWNIAADWHAEHGRPEAAERWRANAERAAESAWMPLETAYKSADLALALTAGLAVGLWLAVFVIGVRRARSEERGWLPRPTAAEVAGLVLAFLVPLPLFWTMQVAVEEVGHLGGAPSEVFTDGWTSPNTRIWLERLEPSPARAELLDQVEAISQATLAGEEPPIPPPDQSLVVDAIQADARAAAWDELTTHFEPAPLAQRDLPPFSIMMPGWLIGVAFWLLLGGYLGHRFPRFQTAARYSIPGGARSASFLTPFMLAATFAAIGSLVWGIDSILEELSQPSFGKYFGLESVYSPDDFGQTDVQWSIVLGVVLVIHVATLWWDRREDEAS